MAAPALVALAHGSRDRRSAATVKALVAEVRAMRPDLKVEAAFLELSKPDFHTVVDRLVKAGSRRDRRRTPPADGGLPRQGRRAVRRRRGLRPAPAGAHPGHVDPRPRGVVPRGARRAAARGAQRVPGSASSTRWCWPRPAPATRSPTRPSPGWPGVWGTHHKLPVTAAYASSSPPATGEAVRAFRGRGPPPHRGRLAVPRPRLPAGPRRRARPRGRRRRRLRAPRRPPQPGPRRPGPLRRRRRRARPRLARRVDPSLPDSNDGSASMRRAVDSLGNDGSASRRAVRRRRSSWRAGSAVTPPWTGPGWRTVERGALRKPNRWVSGSAAGAPPVGWPAQTASTKASDSQTWSTSMRGSRASSRSRSTCQATSRKSAIWQCSTTPTLTNSSRSTRGTQRSTTYS